MKIVLLLITLLIPVQTFAASADDFEEAQVISAKAFIKEYPLIENRVDELGLVDLWQRIKGLDNLIDVWYHNESAFHRAGPGELRSWYIYKRIYSHRTKAPVFSEDNQVAALSALVKLYGSFADRYMNGEIKYGVYVEVASFAKYYGRDLAKQVEKKYGKGKKILKTD